MLDPLDIARFTTAQAATACGITPGSLAAILHRGAVVLSDDEAPETRNPGTGRTRLFTARRVLHLALTLELAGFGLPISDASRLALVFSHVGGSGHDRATLLDEPATEDRAPGHLIEGAAAVFRCLFPVDRGAPVGRVDSLDAVQSAPLRGEHALYRAAVLIDLDRLHGRVLAALGMLAPRSAA